MKQSKRSRIYYHGVILIILMLFNLLALPRITQRQVIEVDYGTFLFVRKERKAVRAKIQDQENVFCFTDKDETKVYAKSSEGIKFSDVGGGRGHRPAFSHLRYEKETITGEEFMESLNK